MSIGIIIHAGNWIITEWRNDGVVIVVDGKAVVVGHDCLRWIVGRWHDTVHISHFSLIGNKVAIAILLLLGYNFSCSVSYAGLHIPRIFLMAVRYIVRMERIACNSFIGSNLFDGDSFPVARDFHFFFSLFVSVGQIHCFAIVQEDRREIVVESTGR